ncbi:hypothetical protein EDC01DRAFT_380509 [Geopyxis carbonaria]|nr:hypothetical protein EDC01DRAFT_380509 [Geopyxis carbonaria]
MIHPNIPLKQSRTFLSKFRSTLPQTTVAANGERNAYPARLLFYYAGKRTVYLGTLKLYAVILFSYCSLIVAPSIFEDQGTLMTAGIIIGSIVPLIFVQTLSPPYVTHAYIHLPPWAQYSKKHLIAYVKQLPRDATVQLATIRWFGRPKLTTMKLGELHPQRRRWGCVNLVRQKSKGIDSFYMDPRGSPATVPEKEVFAEVLRAVQQKRSSK